MAYTIGWYVEGKIVRVAITSELTDAQVDALDTDMLTYFDRKTIPLLHFIFDASSVEDKPNLKSMASMKAGKHPDMGWNIVVGQLNPVITFVVSLVAQINKARFRSFKQMDEAVAFLKKVEPQLQDEEIASH